MLNQPDQLQRVACCLLKVAAEVLEEHGLSVPAKQIPSHKGLDDHCENCEGMFASIESSIQADEVFGERCVDMRAWTFRLDILRQVCTEDIDCEQASGCGEPDEDTGCCEDIPVTAEPEPCSQSPKPTVAEESARFWRERYVIEKELVDRMKCCLEECHRIRCQGIALGIVTEATEGNCHYLSAELVISF